MKPALLDTNVLLALAWPNHQHHAQAHTWFSANAKKGWATCALTQLVTFDTRMSVHSLEARVVEVIAT
ncbi:MAG: hypothetical protein ACKV19_25485 [Verrucomicrobiales bacterium]